MGFDLVRARMETPGCANVLHFNNAGAALMPKPVLEAVTAHLHLEASIGAYEAAKQERARIERVYSSIAGLIGAAPAEIAIVENATRAWDMAFYAVPLRSGDRILTSMAEYASNFVAFLQVAERTGARVEVIPNDEHGQISIQALRKAIDDRVRLIAITHVPSNGGLINPAEAVGQVAREAGVLFLLDACQSIGQLPVDVNRLGCDLLSATGRKYLRGPRGTGFLYVRRQIMDRLKPPLLDLHAARWVSRTQYELRPDARRFENWECNVAAKIGLGVAVDYALQWGIGAIAARVTALGERLRESLRSVPGVAVHDRGERRCGIVSFTVADQDPVDLQAALAQRRVNVHVSKASSTLLDMQERCLEKVVRASVHYYNSEAEIKRFCAILQALA